MSEHIRGNVVGYLALFLALTLGTAYAIDKNAVKSKHIGKGQVKKADLGNAAVTNAKLAPNSVNGGNIVDDSLKGADVDESSLDLPAPPPIPTSLPPSGSAGGDLSGEHPNPQIGAGSVGTNEVDSSLTGGDIVESSLSGIGAGVVSARINNLPDAPVVIGPPAGTATGSASTAITEVFHVAPSVATVARDFSIRLVDTSAEFEPGDSITTSLTVTPLGGGPVDHLICQVPAPASGCAAAAPISLPANGRYHLSIQRGGSPPVATQDVLVGYRLVTP